MSDERKDGGPVAPYKEPFGLNFIQHLGLSVRDHFAELYVNRFGSNEHFEVLARKAYGFADAMLAERSKE